MTERLEIAWQLGDKRAVDLKVRVVPLGMIIKGPNNRPNNKNVNDKSTSDKIK
jgi:hypothetical protein